MRHSLLHQLLLSSITVTKILNMLVNSNKVLFFKLLIFHPEPASGAGVGLGSGKFRFPNYDVFTLCESFLRNSRYCGYGQQFLKTLFGKGDHPDKVRGFQVKDLDQVLYSKILARSRLQKSAPTGSANLVL